MRKLFTLFIAALVLVACGEQNVPEPEPQPEPQPEPEQFPGGKLPGVFTVDANGAQVQFSRGNLQYQASTETWRFALHQWDFVGDDTKGTVFEDGKKCDNNEISDTYSGWIDLFCWGTGDNPIETAKAVLNKKDFKDWGQKPSRTAVMNRGNGARCKKINGSICSIAE